MLICIIRNYESIRLMRLLDIFIAIYILFKPTFLIKKSKPLKIWIIQHGNISNLIEFCNKKLSNRTLNFNVKCWIIFNKVFIVSSFTMYFQRNEEVLVRILFQAVVCGEDRHSTIGRGQLLPLICSSSFLWDPICRCIKLRNNYDYLFLSLHRVLYLFLYHVKKKS